MKLFVLTVALLALGRRAVAQDDNGKNDLIDGLKDLIEEHKEEEVPVFTCAEGEFQDCDDKCFKSIADGGCKVYGLENSEDCNVLVGDYVCDQGQRILSDGAAGPNLYCEKFNWDEGDCDCGEGRTMTCSGYCLSDNDCLSDRWKKDSCRSWLNDNVCDYGQRISDAGITMHFECSRFNFDNFACDENATCEDFDLSNIEEACPDPSVAEYVAFPTEQPTRELTISPTGAPTYGNCKSDEIDDIEKIVTDIQEQLTAHATLMAEFVANGPSGLGHSPAVCEDDYYARIKINDNLSLYCDELDISYNDCDSAEAKEKCCK